MFVARTRARSHNCYSSPRVVWYEEIRAIAVWNPSKVIIKMSRVSRYYICRRYSTRQPGMRSEMQISAFSQLQTIAFKHNAGACALCNSDLKAIPECWILQYLPSVMNAEKRAYTHCTLEQLNFYTRWLEKYWSRDVFTYLHKSP